MSESPAWMIYGANGYTGRLIAHEAARRGLRPILAGRKREKIEAMAAELDCPSKVFSLRSIRETASCLPEAVAVLNCAGPFSQTAETMMEACLRAGVHYLDITGEIGVIELAAKLDARAKTAGICLLPAVGFDVVPTDCLAARLAQKLPSATHLELAFWSTDGLSRGTARTVWKYAGEGGCIRIDGRLTRVPHARTIVEIPFRDRRRKATTIPWGDVASAFYTTGIPNIEVFVAPPPFLLHALRLLRRLSPLARFTPIRQLADWSIRGLVRGPSERQRHVSQAQFWGRVSDASGRNVQATLATPGGYALTIETALAAVRRVLDEGAPEGFSTPAKAFGADFILEQPGTSFQWQGADADTS